MPMPFQPWRAALVPASFAGCGFYVQGGGFAGGRRLAVHEYPKQDTPFTEDMGRKARRWQVTAYVIGPLYLAARDALIAACEAEGPATLVHPSLGSQQVHCENCTPTEQSEKGGFCAFELAFVEAGQDPGASTTADTQAQATSAASASNDATAASTDAGLSGQGGIGSDTVATAQATAAAQNYTPVTTPMASPNDSFGGPSAPLTYPGGSGGIGSA